jgi:aminoglycoside phosphotransferase (APT) family kinase protein
MSELPESSLTPVRDAHRFDEAALTGFMEREVAGYRGPLQVWQFEGGQSNPTFLLQAASGEYVLRKQPPGKLLPSAHQVDREYRVMNALRDTPVPVPRMHALCEDPSVIGTKFYVMEKVEGRIYSDSLLPGFTPDQRRALYLDFARVLAELQNVDVRDVGLEDFGRPGNYYERQISRWTKQYLASKTDEIESMEKLMTWLPENVPQSDRSVIVHGDFRIGNAIIDPTEPRIVALLDWELSTLGDPVADLGHFCVYMPGGSAGQGQVPKGVDLKELGIPSEQEMVDTFCKYAGIERIENWPFYLVYNLFRLAGIIQGVYKRGLEGNASSRAALGLKAAARQRADRAWQMVEEMQAAS